MDSINISLKAFMAMDIKEQMAESTLASLETDEMLALLYEYKLSQPVKKAIVDYLLEARMEDDSEENASSKWIDPDQFKSLPQDEQLSAANLVTIKDKFLVTLLIDDELSDMAREAIYRQLVSDIKTVEEVITITGTDNDRVYPALNVIVSIFKVVAGLIVVVGIIIIVLTLKAGYSSLASAAAILLYTAILAIVAYASAELIRVLTDISSTTYKILNQMKQNEKK